MSFFQRILLTTLKKYSVPVFKSFFKAYKESTAKFSKKDGKQHPFDKYFGAVLSKTNISAPELTQSTALQILNIEQSIQNVSAQKVLERYYILFKKNEPKIGGTAYIQSKVFAAKQCLMAKFQNAQQLEQKFYKQFVEPEILKQQQQQRAQRQNQQKQKQQKKIEQEQLKK